MTINFTATSTRYVRLNITGNTGWAAGQISEFEVYGPTTGGDTQAPSTPGNLTFTEPASNQIRLAWSASTDNVGVTGYEVFRNGTSITTVTGNVLTYTDTQPSTATVTYTVRARDAAGNTSGQSNSVTRQGQSGGDTQAPSAPRNLSYTEPASGQIRLDWGAATDNVAVTGYEVFRNRTSVTTVTGLTYTDSQPATATVSYQVRAKDAAGNNGPLGNSVTRPGSSQPGANLAHRQGDHRVGPRPHLRRGQRQRQQPRHLLGGRVRRLAERAHRQARGQRLGHLGGAEAQPVVVVGLADPEHPGLRP